MAKLTLTNITTGYFSAAAYNANNALIVAALENTLSRDGTSPNTMSANLDMNSNKITNLTDGTNNQDAVTYAQLQAAALGNLVDLTDLADVTITSATTGDVLYYSGTAWVDTALSSLITEAIVEGALTGITAFTVGNYVFNVDQTVGAGQDNYVLTYDHGSGEILLEAAAGGGGLANVVEDTTPQLGGNLDSNAFDIIMADNDQIIFGTGSDVVTDFDGTNLVTVGVGTADWNISGFNAINVQDVFIRRPALYDIAYGGSAPGSAAGAITLNIENGNVFQTTLGENITSITLSNPATTGRMCEIMWKITQAAGSYTVSGWPASVKWPGGTAPTMSSTNGDVDIIILRTWDAGTTWFGTFAQSFT